MIVNFAGYRENVTRNWRKNIDQERIICKKRKENQGKPPPHTFQLKRKSWFGKGFVVPMVAFSYFSGVPGDLRLLQREIEVKMENINKIKRSLFPEYFT